MKIVVASDNHGNLSAIRKIIMDNPNADYYWHLGDSCLEDINSLRPFISIRGNNDYDISLPLQRVIDIDNHKILLIHGHKHIYGDLSYLYEYAKSLNCDIVLYGHTHMYDDREYKGVRFINPGSCSFNRDGDEPTYCILDINKDSIKAIKKYVN